MAIRVSYTKYSYPSRVPLAPSEYERLKSIPTKQYLSDIWNEMRREKKRYKLSRRKPRLISLGVFLIDLPFLFSGNENIMFIGIIPAGICFFWWMSEFLSAHSHFEATGQRYNCLKMTREFVDKSRDYEDYFIQFEAKHLR